LAAIGQALPKTPGTVLAPLRRGETVTLSLGGVDYVLAPDDVLIGTEQAADWVAGDTQGVQIAMSTVLTPPLVREGMARDFVRQVQQLRKEADLEIEDRIRIGFAAGSDEVRLALQEWGAYIQGETLADAITAGAAPAGAGDVLVGDQTVQLWIERLAK
jgi:isoleucyl-tRNA synthetase